jgi:histidinol-phosphate/aromatic aminotransferase/cobyric acid decarboxylase-like protein
VEKLEELYRGRDRIFLFPVAASLFPVEQSVTTALQQPIPLSPSRTHTTSIMPILGLTEQGPTQPAHFSLESIIRPNILALVPYRSARDDYDQGILLDANENALGPCLPAIHELALQRAHVGVEDMPSVEEEKVARAFNKDQENGDATAGTSDPLVDMSKEELATLNRYPSPTHDPLKSRIATLRGVPNPNWVFLGVGSDEVIDLLFRVSCVPGKDVVITTPPTYGMYEVTANVNDVGVVKVPLVTEGGKFEVDMPAVSAQRHSAIPLDLNAEIHSPALFSDGESIRCLPRRQAPLPLQPR